jgi:hypothetical protein
LLPSSLVVAAAHAFAVVSINLIASVDLEGTSNNDDFVVGSSAAVA